MFFLLILLWLLSFIGYHILREKVWVIYDNQYLWYYKIVKYINILSTIAIIAYEYLDKFVILFDIFK